MFLRRNRRIRNGETYEYWSLMRTVRTANGPRHELVANLGKAPGLDEGVRHGWEHIADLLEGREGKPVQGRLGQPLSPPRPQWTSVDLSALRVERVRDFGDVYLALALWRRLGLHTLLRELIEPGRETVPWELVACILTIAIARFCGNKSELEVAERWYDDSALADLLGVPFEAIHHTRLYRGLDVLNAHKDRLCQHLLARYESWFGVEFEFLVYDVTSTYFEGKAEANTKAACGYSRDQRPDCKQVNIGLVCTPEGLPIAYEVFAGNTAAVRTVEDMVEMMEQKYGQARRVWVMDRGMVSEDNIDFLRERKARYIVGTPKQQLRQFESQLLDQSNWTEVQPGVEVKLAAHPDGEGSERYVLGRYPGAEKLIDVRVELDDKGRACALRIEEKAQRRDWAGLAQGAYLLRTNCTEDDPAALWRWYIHLTQAEECFKISKSDLHLRPVFHQTTERVEAHILVYFLTLALWRTLEMWMKAKASATVRVS